MNRMTRLVAAVLALSLLQGCMFIVVRSARYA